MQGSEEALTGDANATILMGDFGIGPIRIDNILNTDDNVQITLNFSARP